MAKVYFAVDKLNELIPDSVFTWENALYSNSAKDKGLLPAQYSPEDTTVDNIEKLFAAIVNPLTTAFPGQVAVNSVYRSPAVNHAVNGSARSQHLRGQAVDLRGVNGLSNREIFNWIIANVKFDQLIWEFGTVPVIAAGSPLQATGGNPRWIHVSFDSAKATQRADIKKAIEPNKYINISASGDNTDPGKDEDSPTTTNQAKSNNSEGLNGNAGDDSNNPNFTGTFEQINRNLANSELGDVDVTWGKRVDADEDSDWIGLKQFLLYLCSRFSPQSLFPFVELIPKLTIDKGIDVGSTRDNNSKGYAPDGQSPKDVEENSATFSKGNAADRLKKKAEELKKFVSEVPPGYSKERFDVGAEASNKASEAGQEADLFSLDPFKEGINFIGELSPGGKTTVEQRNVGVRVYGQMVLNAAPIEGVPSKPGAIGFTNLEVKAGSAADDGMALISMTLVDVQGNKFTDVNSPWAFIYDARPGNVGGDFLFRYGWQIRLPEVSTTDSTSLRFWNHEGWALFGNAREQIRKQLVPGKNLITLTQAINGTAGADERTRQQIKDGVPNNDHLALFDEGVVFDEVDGTVSISRQNTLNPNSTFVSLSIINPELKQNEDGSIEASLHFRTTGAIAQSISLNYAADTRKLLQQGNVFKLGDVLLAVINDSNKYGFLALDTREKRLKQAAAADKSIKDIDKTRDFENLVYISGGDVGTIHPDDIRLEIKGKLLRKLIAPNGEDGETLIGWFRKVLQENDCELLSAATGSGSGINSNWVIVTTQKLNKARVTNRKKKQQETRTLKEDFASIIKQEKDVFSFRFQGSLVSSMVVEKTDATNAMKIQADLALANQVLMDGSDEGTPLNGTNPVTAIDRKSNLITIFSQMQNINITCLAHPWIGPGEKVFVKGLGFYDGEYLVLEVTHRLDGHLFTSNIIGARILVQAEDKPTTSDKSNSSANGRSNMTQKVDQNFIGK